MKLHALGAEIKAAIKSTGLPAHGWEVARFSTPCALVNPADPHIVYDGSTTFAAPYEAAYTIQILTGRAASDATARQLDDWIGALLAVLVGGETTPGDGPPTLHDVRAPLIGADDGTVGAEITVSYPITMKED